MSDKSNSKLILVDSNEVIYIFKKDSFEPAEVKQNIFFYQKFEFIISSKNYEIKNYFAQLQNFKLGLIDYIDLLKIKEQLSLGDISSDLNKVRDVNSIYTNDGKLNIINADNIILDSFEITLNDDFNIVKESVQYNPFIQNPNSALGLFENATLFKPFLEESLGVDLTYFSFNKYKNQLYINFIDDSNQQYFIKDNLLNAFVKENSLSFDNLYQNKYKSNYKKDSEITFKNYYEASSQIKKVLKSLDDLNNQNNDTYISSQSTSLIFNASLTALSCINNPSIVLVLIILLLYLP